MKFVCTTERWRAMGQPDLGSKIYLRDRKTSKKNYFEVVSINYGYKKGIKLSLVKIKKSTKTNPVDTQFPKECYK